MHQSPGIQTSRLPVRPDAIAPDGSAVRVLARTAQLSTAHFELPPGATSVAVRHRTIEEVWFILSGRGEMWRAPKEGAEVTAAIEAGVTLVIPVACSFQFRSTDNQALTVVATSVPPFPVGDSTEVEMVDGPWTPTEVAGKGEHVEFEERPGWTATDLEE